MFNRGLAMMLGALSVSSSMSMPVTRDVNRRSAAPGLGSEEGMPDGKRSRGAQAKPKKRPNRLIVSKRTRRKHRRAR